MPEQPDKKVSKTKWTSRLARRGVSLLLAGTFAVCLIMSSGYHFMSLASGEPGSAAAQMLYMLTSVLGYTALWFGMKRFFQDRSGTPSRILWSVMVIGLILVAIAGITSRFGIISAGGIELPLGFDPDTGVPLTSPTIIKMIVVSLAQVLFAFVLMQRLQNLVLVKRTKTSQRNWHIMLSLMAASSMLTVMKPAGADQNEWQNIAFIVAVVFMLVNSFKLSWIVFLSFKEKMATIGLCFALAALLVLGLGIGNSGVNILVPRSYEYLEFYFVPLASFVKQVSIFGILYCMTAFLSLLFHLPTTSDYEQREGERATMYSLAHLVGQVFDAEKLFVTVASAPVEAGSADFSWLAMPDHQTGSLEYRIIQTHNITAEKVSELIDSDLLVEDMLTERMPVLVQRAAADHRMNVKPSNNHLGSLLVVPLIARDQIIGALFAGKHVVNGFERDDVETISVFAAQAALAIDNAHLFEQQVEKERLSRELSIAREVQRRLLPQNVPSMSGMTMAASSVSAQEVGGDYYDFVRLDERKLGVIIGDVSGKGTSAAFYMAEMQGIFQSVSRLTDSPSVFLHHANMALGQSLDRNVFISAIYGILDLEEESLVIARAGHCPAAIVRMNGESRFIRTQGMGLGLDRGSLFQRSLTEEFISLEPGDVVVLYTDGVVESRSEAGEEYGYERLLALLNEYRHDDADGIHAAVLRDLRGFMAGEEYDDDMTLVVLKWHGIPIESFTQTDQTIQESA
jgi:sigma-B regulation protein RsbU (phosphoserine phosphatase)